MKPNVIVALLVGLVLGFAGGKFASGPAQSTGTPSAAQQPSPTAPVVNQRIIAWSE